MTDRILLPQLSFMGKHGASAREKGQAQPFLIDLVLYIDLSAAAESDCLTKTVDYSKIYLGVKEIVETHSYSLLERLAQVIADKALSYERVKKVKVTVEKPEAKVENCYFRAKVVLERLARAHCEKVFIGLGSNLGDREACLERAVQKMNALEGVRVVTKSPIYQTPPWGVGEQPDYYNAVVELECTISAEQLLRHIQQIELDLGRERKEHWEPRTIDIDILIFGDQVIRDADLKVPHPLLSNRLFVLYPLADLAPELEVPQCGKVSDLLAKRVLEEPDHGIERITEIW